MDACDRLTIQDTYSYIFPIKAMRAWVTDCEEDCRSNLFLNGSLFTHFSSLVLKYDLPHIYIKGGIFPINLMTQGGLYDYVKSILYL